MLYGDPGGRGTLTIYALTWLSFHRRGPPFKSEMHCLESGMLLPSCSVLSLLELPVLGCQHPVHERMRARRKTELGGQQGASADLQEIPGDSGRMKTFLFSALGARSAWPLPPHSSSSGHAPTLSDSGRHFLRQEGPRPHWPVRSLRAATVSFIHHLIPMHRAGT